MVVRCTVRVGSLASRLSQLTMIVLEKLFSIYSYILALEVVKHNLVKVSMIRFTLQHFV